MDPRWFGSLDPDPLVNIAHVMRDQKGLKSTLLATVIWNTVDEGTVSLLLNCEPFGVLFCVILNAKATVVSSRLQLTIYYFAHFFAFNFFVS